jgi:Toprim-like
VAGVLQEGPVGSAWFAHFDRAGAVAHVDIHGPTYRGSLTGGIKSLFRLPFKGPPLPRLVLTEAAIDALSLADIENLRGGTLYTATGGGMGPGTIAALEALLVDIARLPDALFCSATDADGPGDRFAESVKAYRRPTLREDNPTSG